MLIVFDSMIADMLSNKKLNPMATEFFISGKKLNISLVFISQSYFAVPKYIRRNLTHYLVTKSPNKRELQQIVHTTLASDNSTFFRKNLPEKL